MSEEKETRFVEGIKGLPTVNIVAPMPNVKPPIDEAPPPPPKKDDK
jgi:hypothetical protein